jgi:hypothetical protein
MSESHDSINKSNSSPVNSENHDSHEDESGELVVTSLEVAAREAALADGLIPVPGTSAVPSATSVPETANQMIEASPIKPIPQKKTGLRRGKWTPEEEAYANRLIFEFKLGLLPLTDGTTLRTFLSKLLNCDPMRISKKFVGQNCIGKVSSLFSLSFFGFSLSYISSLIASIPSKTTRS